MRRQTREYESFAGDGGSQCDDRRRFLIVIYARGCGRATSTLIGIRKTIRDTGVVLSKQHRLTKYLISFVANELHYYGLFGNVLLNRQQCFMYMSSPSVSWLLHRHAFHPIIQTTAAENPPMSGRCESKKWKNKKTNESYIAPNKYKSVEVCVSVVHRRSRRRHRRSGTEEKNNVDASSSFLFFTGVVLGPCHSSPWLYMFCLYCILLLALLFYFSWFCLLSAPLSLTVASFGH